VLKKQTLIIVLVVIVLGLGSAIFILSLNRANSVSKTAKAGSSQVVITTDEDWNEVTLDNIGVANGSISINDKTLTFADISGAININIHAPGGSTFEPLYYDLGQEYMGISRIDLVSTHSPGISFSTDNINWSNWEVIAGGENLLPTSYTGRYIQLSIDCGGPPETTCHYDNFRAYQSSALATHIAQVDGGANFWSWDANTIAQTVPANTTATYQYRTSANGTDWTAWVGDIGSVTSRTGDDSNNPTRYRYLQIKATLTSTDGVSSPQIDSYAIDYHTEVKPSAPSAQTAVVQ
jgi:hypothetical protein